MKRGERCRDRVVTLAGRYPKDGAEIERRGMGWGAGGWGKDGGYIDCIKMKRTDNYDTSRVQEATSCWKIRWRSLRGPARVIGTDCAIVLGL